MLPKVATNLLHSTVTRGAAAAVQNQANLRNVLQLHPNNNGASASGAGAGTGLVAASASSSSVSANGTMANAHGGSHGHGGSKNKPGSRFYTGYNSAARAVTQANALTSQDGPAPADEEDMHPAARRAMLKKSVAPTKRTRLRSSSVNSLLPRDKGKKKREDALTIGEKPSVLKVVQLQGALAARPRQLLSSSSPRPPHRPSRRPLRISRYRHRPLLLHLSRWKSPNSHQLAYGQGRLPPSPPLLDFAATRRRPRFPSIRHLSSTPLKSPYPASPQLSDPSQLDLPQARLHDEVSERSATPESPIGWLIRSFRAAMPEGVRREAQALIDLPAEASEKLNVADYNCLLWKVSLCSANRTSPLNLPLGALQRHALALLSTLLESFESLPEKDRKGFEAIKEENNFPSAMRLFEAVVSVGGNSKLNFMTYKRLLASAAIHGNVNAALHILSYLEQRDQLPDPHIFRNLMCAFKNSGDYKGAELVFNKYRRQGGEGRAADCWEEMMDIYFRKGEPEKAVETLETMLKAAEEGEASTIPSPITKTYTAVINGFINAGDVTTALSWFNRLLQQTDAPAEDSQASLPNGHPTKPNRTAWMIMIDALVKEKRVDELNALFKALLNDGERIPNHTNRSGALTLRELYKTVLEANLESVQTVERDVALQRLGFVNEHFLKTGRAWDHFQHQAAFGFLRSDFAEKFVYGQLEVMDKDNTLAQYDAVGVTQSLQNFVLGVMERICNRTAKTQTPWSFVTAMNLARLASERLGLRIPPAQAGWLLHNYSKDKQAGLVDGAALPIDAWRVLLSSALYLEREPLPADVVPKYAFQGLPSFLEDMAAANARMTVVEHVSLGRDVDWCKEYFGRLGPAYLATYEEVVAVRYNQLKEQLDAAAPSPIDRIDMVSPPPTARVFRNSLSTSAPVSTQIDNLLKSYPAHHHRPRGAGACGRLNQLDRVQEIYGVAQAYLASAKGKIYEGKRGVWWVQIEDNMIVALAQAGDVEAAHVHRLRILEFSARLWTFVQPQPRRLRRVDPQRQGHHRTTPPTRSCSGPRLFKAACTPTSTSITTSSPKLARARKADQALELFKQMRECGVKPSSITYGAMIGACARVGDTVSAEALFQEMSEQRNFKPRVPPFNTMMQMYTATKPNRERALWFYEEMVRQGVHPTCPHLQDIYGSIEPVDIGAMESVWEQLTSDSSVQINGTHFRDVDRAIATFDSIPELTVSPGTLSPTRPSSTPSSRTSAPELIRSFMERMVEDSVHMTAYVANFLIKGYANSGDVEQARTIFESMLDPPTGVAAPNNHAPHEPATAPTVGVMEPVYREPSTWEAMIRAELGVGNRDRAQSLLDRLRSRQYPEAVFNRISGVMVDHSIPPLP
ncbi:hypothetical protein FA13DRAFT_1865883 [Coprinellus micaceus]|uniref:PROP1-like PPR domain-containing protein n=1 Tax=Coprinellus micaceus TaxID=71717 RepID=A0A4Y7T424_COPMI|nr:hypothetical protein FA13DRAFT_1865883 [Coprinellus micaceus]